MLAIKSIIIYAYKRVGYIETSHKITIIHPNLVSGGMAWRCRPFLRSCEKTKRSTSRLYSRFCPSSSRLFALLFLALFLPLLLLYAGGIRTMREHVRWSFVLCLGATSPLNLWALINRNGRFSRRVYTSGKHFSLDGIWLSLLLGGWDDFRTAILLYV